MGTAVLNERRHALLRGHAVRWYVWAYSLVLTATGRIWTARAPGVADAELFAYMGRAWHRGVVPYVGIWDDKPPGILAVNWFAAFSQRQFAVLALFEFLAIVATLWIVSRLFALEDRLPELRWIAPFVLANALAVSGYSLGGNYTELYILPFAALSIYSFARVWRSAKDAVVWYLLAGAASGVASAFKPVGMASLLAIVAFLVLARREPVRSRVQGALLVCSGFAVVWVLIAAGFARVGAARLMYDATITYNLHYGAATHISPLMKVLLTIDRLLPVPSVLACACAGLVLVAFRLRKGAGTQRAVEDSTELAGLYVLWVGADIAGANAGGRYYAHYFIPALLSLSVLACVGIGGILRSWPAASGRTRLLLYCGVLMPFAFLGLRGQIDAYHAVTGNAADPVEQAARYVRDHRGSHDTLYTWTFRPGIYRLSGTHTTVRFASAQYLSDFPEAYRTIGPEILATLAKDPPGFILLDCDMKPEGPGDAVRSRFLQYVAGEYSQVYRTGNECVVQHH